MTLGVVYALGRVFGIINPGTGGIGGSGLRLPSLGSFGKTRRAPPGAGPGRWVKDRTLGGREIWVEDKYRAKRSFGGAMDDILAEPGGYVGGVSERAANERKAAEAKEAKAQGSRG